MQTLTYPMIMFTRIRNKPTRKHRYVVDGLAWQRMVCDIVDIWFFYPSMVGEKVGRCLSKGCSIGLNMAWYIWRLRTMSVCSRFFFFKCVLFRGSPHKRAFWNPIYRWSSRLLTFFNILLCIKSIVSNFNLCLNERTYLSQFSCNICMIANYGLTIHCPR